MLLFKLALVLVILASLQLTEACLLDSTCLPSQYCETSFPNPIGKCVDGLEEGKACLRDRTCASKQCSFFRCKKRVGVSNGPCKHSADCLNTQYCDDIPGRKDLRQCFDRKCMGTCTKDSECLSDKCDFFRCRKGPSC